MNFKPHWRRPVIVSTLTCEKAGVTPLPQVDASPHGDMMVPNMGANGQLVTGSSGLQPIDIMELNFKGLSSLLLVDCDIASLWAPPRVILTI